MTDEVDFLVKLRDACAMIKDACEERLESLAPPGCERASQGPAAGSADTWNAAKVKWTAATGPSGAYEKSTDADSPDFKNLVNDLRAHSGKLTRDNWFFWLFEDGVTVGRKKRR